jgi:hypothetical protein
MYNWRPGQLPIGQTAKARSGYRVQSLRKRRDRQCKTNPTHVSPSELVKTALPFYIAVGLTKSVLCRTRELPVSGWWLCAGGRDCRFQRRGGAPRLTVVQCDQTTVWATLRIVCSEEVGQSLQGRVRFLLRVRLQHGNNPDCSSGTFSARRRRMGIFAVAQLKQLHNERALSGSHRSPVQPGGGPGHPTGEQRLEQERREKSR